MKTQIEIALKKIRKELKAHDITNKQKEILRNQLSELKEIQKLEKLAQA